MPLSRLLRDRTRDAHMAAESAFALETRLCDRSAYAGLLRDLRGFYRPVEAALWAIDELEELTTSRDIATRRRARLIDEDLRRLGAPLAEGTTSVAAPELHSLADALGCWYVLEGAALGGQIVARRAVGALGDDLPVGFFSQVGSEGLPRRWRSVQAALDEFGRRTNATTREDIITAAHSTFETLRVWLRGEVTPR